MMIFPAPILRRLLALACVALAVPAVLAQALPTESDRDPPGQVARFDVIDGAVSFASGEAGGWDAAQPNRPLTAGDRIWTADHARSELHAGSTAVRMGAETGLQLIAVDDDLTQLQLAQGTLSLRVRTLFDGQRIQVDTPNLAFTVAQPGEYRIDVDPVRNSTRIGVFAGSGAAYGEGGVSYALGNGLQVTFGGTNLAQIAVQNMPARDAFDSWAAARDRLEDQSVTARYISREIPGYQQLDQYGDWASDPGYGAIWYPRAVAADWAPYRAGRWADIAPWGWTWIDDAPWGFAPFHYGRWTTIGARWAWVPGPRTPRPVYAPALVGFVGGAGPGVAWFPLAPGEAWRPYHRASPRYVSRINAHGAGSHPPHGNYRYYQAPHAITAVSAESFAQGRPVRNDPIRLRQDDLARAQVIAGPGVQPDLRGPRFFGGRPATATPPATLSGREALSQRAANDRPGAFMRPGVPLGRDAGDAREDRGARPAPRTPPANDGNGWRSPRPWPADTGVRPGAAPEPTVQMPATAQPQPQPPATAQPRQPAAQQSWFQRAPQPDTRVRDTAVPLPRQHEQEQRMQHQREQFQQEQMRRAQAQQRIQSMPAQPAMQAQPDAGRQVRIGTMGRQPADIKPGGRNGGGGDNDGRGPRGPRDNR